MKAEGAGQSQFELGAAFFRGDLGVAKDAVEAVKWYRKAAEQGFPPAQGSLGRCYALGEGVAKDFIEAVKWLRKAAEQGYAKAQSNLGVAYRKGEGVPKDFVEAVKWSRKGADQGDGTGQINLGAAYEHGDGVSKDLAEAVKWYRKAAEQNYATAQNNLGRCYAKGEGVVKDEVEGYKWFLLAVGQGDEGAKKNMAVSERRLTREQIAEGQKLARNFKPRKAPESSTSFSGNEVADSSPSASGTGFFITEDGFLITNEHVVRDAAQVRLVTSAGLISAKVLKVDAANDLSRFAGSRRRGGSRRCRWRRVAR